MSEIAQQSTPGAWEASALLIFLLLRLEKLIRECLATNNHDRIRKVVHQLCHDYAYAVHQPYARNGGLIGLAAASIALGPVRWVLPEALAQQTDHILRTSQHI